VSKSDEITRNQARALMDQLIERMLSVRAGLAPKDRTGVIGDLFSVKGYVLAVTLHRQLLKVRWEPFQILFVWQDRDRLGIKKVGLYQTVSKPRRTGRFRSNAAVRKCSSI